jgi:hypothetical protein
VIGVPRQAQLASDIQLRLPTETSNCNGCWSDPRERFDRHDFLVCPRHKDTPRQFECTRLITADHVKAVIRRIPGFVGATSAS